MFLFLCYVNCFFSFFISAETCRISLFNNATVHAVSKNVWRDTERCFHCLMPWRGSASTDTRSGLVRSETASQAGQLWVTQVHLWTQILDQFSVKVSLRSVGYTYYGEANEFSIGGCAPTSKYSGNCHPASHSVDRAGWQAKMASIELWIQWRNAHGPIRTALGFLGLEYIHPFTILCCVPPFVKD